MKLEILPEQTKQVLIGSLLGDGSLQKQHFNSNPEFQEKHCLKQKEYLLWKKDILSKKFNMMIYNYPNYIYLRSSPSILLSKYHSLLYPTGKGEKLISIEILNQLGPLGLAIWYMDDGTLNKSRYVIEFFSYKENIQTIKDWFKNKYNMEGKVYFFKNYAMIRFNSKETKEFFRIIHPYIHPSMKYKIKRTKEELLIIKGKEKAYRSIPEVKERINICSKKWAKENKVSKK